MNLDLFKHLDSYINIYIPSNPLFVFSIPSHSPWSHFFIFIPFPSPSSSCFPSSSLLSHFSSIPSNPFILYANSRREWGCFFIAMFTTCLDNYPLIFQRFVMMLTQHISRCEEQQQDINSPTFTLILDRLREIFYTVSLVYFSLGFHL